MFLAWAAYFEGKTDELYFRVLLPRILDDLVRRLNARLPVVISDYPAFRAGELSRARDCIAAEICGGRDEFDIFFVHADTGGRALQQNLFARCEAIADAANELCDFDARRAVAVCPCHETEAWALSDPQAICSSLGYNGRPQDLALPESPREAERLPDPKAKLNEALALASSRRRIVAGRLLPLIAQRQSLESLRRMQSFRKFEEDLKQALDDTGFLR